MIVYVLLAAAVIAQLATLRAWRKEVKSIKRQRSLDKACIKVLQGRVRWFEGKEVILQERLEKSLAIEGKDLLCKEIHYRGKTYIIARYTEEKGFGGASELHIKAWDKDAFQGRRTANEDVKTN